MKIFWVLLVLTGCTINAPVREYSYYVHMERAQDVQMDVQATLPNKKDEVRLDTRPTTEVDATLPIKALP